MGILNPQDWHGQWIAARYAVAGGVGGAIVETAENRFGMKGISLAKADTLRNCRALLSDIKTGKVQADIVEGMACPGGCVGGPGTLIGLLPAKNEVGKFAAMAPNRLPSSCDG